MTDHKENLKPLSKSKEVASFLGIHDDVVRKSRSTGYLLGRKAPAHCKFGRAVRYKREDVLAWVDSARVGEAA